MQVFTGSGLAAASALLDPGRSLEMVLLQEKAAEACHACGRSSATKAEAGGTATPRGEAVCEASLWSSAICSVNVSVLH